MMLLLLALAVVALLVGVVSLMQPGTGDSGPGSGLNPDSKEEDFSPP